jgi:hypothetical protein
LRLITGSTNTIRVAGSESKSAILLSLLFLTSDIQDSMAPALLTAVDATSHIHLIVGSNPLAAARCTRAIEVGAKPILIAPEDSTLHYGLVKRIEVGEVKWLQRTFREEDLTTLGRPEVDCVVDAVYVTAGGKQISGGCFETLRELSANLPQLPKSQIFAEDCEYRLMSQTHRTFARSHSSPPTQTVHSRLVSQRPARAASFLRGFGERLRPRCHHNWEKP